MPFHYAPAYAAGLAQACNILPWHSGSLFIRHQIQVQLLLRRAQHLGLLTFFEWTDNGGRQEHLWDSAMDHHRVHNLEATKNQSHHGSRMKKRFPASLSASPIRRHSTLCKLKLASFRWWRRAACPPPLHTFRRRCNDCPFFCYAKFLTPVMSPCLIWHTQSAFHDKTVLSTSSSSKLPRSKEGTAKHNSASSTQRMLLQTFAPLEISCDWLQLAHICWEKSWLYELQLPYHDCMAGNEYILRM